MTHRLSINGTEFALGGSKFDMWGIRLANGLENDTAAAALISVLDEYVAHGLNTFAVFLQGGSTGSANPFDADGRFTRNTRRSESSEMFKGRGDLDGIAARNMHLDRLAVLIEEADARGMVVNVGIFYQARIRQLSDEDAVIRATEETARWLVGKQYGNVFVDLANEYGHPGFESMPLCYGRSEQYAPDGGEELITAFKRVAPDIPASISALGPRPVNFRGADLALIHEPFPPTEVREQIGRDLPVVMNEWGFGEVGAPHDGMNGCYTQAETRKWEETVRVVRAGGGFVFYHAQWKQHITEEGGPHFELGPPEAQPRDPRGGAPSDHWYFDLVRQWRGIRDADDA